MAWGPNRLWMPSGAVQQKRNWVPQLRGPHVGVPNELLLLVGVEGQVFIREAGSLP